MYESSNVNNWIKHWDFMLLDLLCMFVSFCVAFWTRFKTWTFWDTEEYLTLGIVLLLLTLLCGQLANIYQGILKRDTIEEVKKVIVLTSVVMLVTLALMFIIKTTGTYSRLVIGRTWLISTALILLEHLIHKKILIKRLSNRKDNKRLLVACCKKDINKIKDSIIAKANATVELAGSVIVDGDGSETVDSELKVVTTKDDVLEYLSRNQVDGVLITREATKRLGIEFIEDCIDMGIPVHRVLYVEDSEYGTHTVEDIAGYTVMTSTLKLATPRQLLMKRTMDIVGGLVGSALAIIIIVLTAPVIFIQSPGPILFKQKRMGRNGRQFTMYKLRTMYTDAEERKAELMKNNKMDGPIFKIDNDPRIYPFGNFLRKTSLDEFPQFFNVVKGDMSLVGTRPPTVDEYNKYEYHHKKRLAIRPGVTGLWQVSGRNTITDFEEIVKLDTEYITNWRLLLDIKILFKTIGVLFTKDGAQ